MQRALKRVVFGALGLLLAACAQQNGGPALWRVRDADSEIYLFGTVHILPPDLRWRTARIDTAFARADTIWFETPTDDAASQEIAAIVAVSGRNPPGVRLSSLLTPADRERLKRVAAKVGLRVDALEYSRPWLAAVQVTLADLQRQGQDANAGVEHVLDAEVKAQHKRTAYFETADEQISLFATLSPADELRFLTSTLRQTDENAEDPRELADLWASGRTDELGRKVRDLAREAGPALVEAMLTRRNRRFAATIEKQMAGSGVAFVAVGAAHMAGPEGVPALLRADGFTVDGPGPFEIAPTPGH